MFLDEDPAGILATKAFKSLLQCQQRPFSNRRASDGFGTIPSTDICRSLARGSARKARIQQTSHRLKLCFNVDLEAGQLGGSIKFGGDQSCHLQQLFSSFNPLPSFEPLPPRTSYHERKISREPQHTPNNQLALQRGRNGQLQGGGPGEERTQVRGT
jgi:hypothetical protein